MARQRGALAWDRTSAAAAAVAALPAGVFAATGDLHTGAALGVGVLPAALAGVAPLRRRRIVVLGLGALVAVCLLAGGVLASAPVLAVAALALLGPATAMLARRSPLGTLAMTLALPMTGIGLSFDSGEALGAAALILAGSVWAWLVALAWPERAPSSPAQRPAAAPPDVGYGVRLGAAGATAAAIGFLLDLDHVGWACAAALLVMRPAAEMQRLRSAGRVLAVLAGALAAIGLCAWDPPAAVYGAAIVATVAAAAGTRPSRWYVTAAFSTFLVFLLFLSADPDAAAERLGERMGETLLGVGLAYGFGLAGRPRRAPGGGDRG